MTEKRPDVYLAAKLEAEADLIEEELLEGLKASELRRKRLGKRKKTCLETVCPQCFRALEVIDEEYFREDIELGRRRQERVDRLRKLAEDIRSTATDEERRKKLIDDYRLESERDKSDLRATKSRSFLADLYGDLDSESLQNLLKDRDKYELETERGRQLLESDEKALQKRKTPKFIREEEPLLADKKVSELVKHLAREKFLNPEQIEKLKEYRKQFRDGKITQAEFENQLEDLLKASKGGPEAERKLSRILEELDDRKDQDIQEDFQLRDRLIDFLKRVDKEFGQEFDEDYERDIRKQIRLAGYDKEDLFGTPEERKQRLLAQLRREEIESELDLTRRKHLEDLLRQIQFEKERRAVRRRKIRLELSKRLDDPLEDAKRRGRLNELLKREDEQSDVETDREKRYLDLLKKAHIDSEERKRRKLRYQDLLRKEGITPELEKKGLGQQIKEALTGKRDRTAILKEQEKKLRDLKRIVEKEVDKTIKRRTTRETRKMQITRAISMGFLGMEWVSNEHSFSLIA